MLCSSCQKLSLIDKIKICVRCKGNITKNIFVICENCSNSEKLCAICLKKNPEPASKKKYTGCSSCGGNK